MDTNLTVIKDNWERKGKFTRLEMHSGWLDSVQQRLYRAIREKLDDYPWLDISVSICEGKIYDVIRYNTPDWDGLVEVEWSGHNEVKDIMTEQTDVDDGRYADISYEIEGYERYGDIYEAMMLGSFDELVDDIVRDIRYEIEKAEEHEIEISYETPEDWE